MAKKTFYFDTGVQPDSGAKLFCCQIWRNGTKQIPFICEDVPDGAVFQFACDNPNLPESTIDSEYFKVIVRPILNSGARGGLLSKYAYFRVYKSV